MIEVINTFSSVFSDEDQDKFRVQYIMHLFIKNIFYISEIYPNIHIRNYKFFGPIVTINYYPGSEPAPTHFIQ